MGILSMIYTFFFQSTDCTLKIFFFKSLDGHITDKSGHFAEHILHYGQLDLAGLK